MSRPRRSWAAWATIPLALVGFGVVVAPSPEVQIHATVNGQPVTVGQPATVGRVLEAAGVTPRDGRLLAAVSGDPVGREIDPATVTVDGRPVGPDDVVHGDQVVRTRDGHDWTEAAVSTTEPVPFTGLPEIERFAWRPGSDGTRRVVSGARSGEAISETVVTEPTAARRVPGQVVTLTFDDGPHAEWTPQILDILRRRRVKAVFCVLGEMVEVHPGLVRRIADEGHLLCDHSVTHADLAELSADRLPSEIGVTADRVTALTGTRPQFFRAPYGSTNDEVIRAAHRADLRVLGWSVDTEDFARPTPTTLVPALVDAVEPGAVVLFHDGGGNRQATVDSLPYVITALRRQGYRFALPGVEPEPTATEAA